jgi:hypothetical protein
MIKDKLIQVRKQLPYGITLVCVSKFQREEAILEAYQVGERVFGESRVQELTTKYENLPKDIDWHFIGHLQTNKVKFLVPFVSLIHGVDSLRLLLEINRQAAIVNRTVDCLLQVHIAQEESKFGFSEVELLNFFESGQHSDFQNITIRGLMGMATFTENNEQITREFSTLKHLFDSIKQKFGATFNNFDILSMGMSDDYLLALEQGSTMVRIGSKIFGQRS